MNPPDAIDLKWILGSGLSLILFLVSLMWGLLESRRTKFEVRMEQWIRDAEEHDRIFRRDEYQRAIADLNAKVWPMEERVKELERNMDRIRHWRHTVGDAYLPRAVDGLEERITRLEKRIFNGHSRTDAS